MKIPKQLMNQTDAKNSDLFTLFLLGADNYARLSTIHGVSPNHISGSLDGNWDEHNILPLKNIDELTEVNIGEGWSFSITPPENSRNHSLIFDINDFLLNQDVLAFPKRYVIYTQWARTLGFKTGSSMKQRVISLLESNIIEENETHYFIRRDSQEIIDVDRGIIKDLLFCKTPNLIKIYLLLLEAERNDQVVSYSDLDFATTVEINYILNVLGQKGMGNIMIDLDRNILIKDLKS